jgi:hypothetical protein
MGGTRRGGWVGGETHARRQRGGPASARGPQTAGGDSWKGGQQPGASLLPQAGAPHGAERCETSEDGAGSGVRCCPAAASSEGKKRGGSLTGRHTHATDSYIPSGRGGGRQGKPQGQRWARGVGATRRAAQRRSQS